MTAQFSPIWTAQFKTIQGAQHDRFLQAGAAKLCYEIDNKIVQLNFVTFIIYATIKLKYCL